MLSRKTYYTYRPHPYQSNSFQIFLMQGIYQDLAGDYLLLDHSEERDLTEKTVMNLVALLNGRNELIDLTGYASGRLYFQKLEIDTAGQGRILFRSYRGDGISTENALLTYNPEKMNV
ncbi:MAG: hypothetical protein H6855_00675 [Rhodospirillales bacterium]|nr:hypothetical protein [Rhodospirillales bacterium]MCB9964583.1 hypothetical protein [Rhodospirillales bacterium]MCB9973894.1 hypothetical protein [Rhodospirillales bacterium]MCB9980519.1 hypothetical protein [Rhodospirillales bacterium]